MTLNGYDYSNDNITFGFYDPYVIDASPRLISTSGTTRVTVKGIGFVNSGETKVVFENSAFPLKCPGDCRKNADYIDKNHITADTLPQQEVTFVSDGKSVMWDGFFIEASVYNNDFTDNRVALYYYEEPTYEVFSGETPANI